MQKLLLYASSYALYRIQSRSIIAFISIRVSHYYLFHDFEIVFCVVL
jgi:hypothetical protein